MNCVVHGVAKSWRLLSDFHFHVYIIESFCCTPEANTIL